MMRFILRLLQFLEDLLFVPPDRPPARVATFVALMILFAVGVGHWIVFFNFGELSFRSGDWPKEYLYYSVLQQALLTGTIPYHVDQVLQNTQRFMALPETVRSPQIILLRFMSIGDFVVANTLVMYAAGFWGCLVIRRRYALSLVSFSLLYLLFNFNGYITSHLATGHSMWNGYFLMPFYCYYVLRLCDALSGTSPGDHRLPLKLALTLFAMNLQGAFHMYVWNVLFLGLVAVFNTRLVRPLAIAVISSAMLSSFILLPAVITFWNADHVFLTGYPTIGVLIEAFVYVRRVDIEVSPATALIGDVGWWEYDMFIGVLACAVVIYLGLWLRWRPPATLTGALEGTEYRSLDWPMAVMGVLSMGAFYAVLALLPLPLLNSERVPSRFLITPFLCLLMMSCVRLDRVLAAWGFARVQSTVRPVKWLIAAALMQTGFELASHSKAWSVDKWPIQFPDGDVDFDISIINHIDPIYQWTVQGSLVMSVLTLVVWIYCYVRPGVTPRRPTSR